MNNKDLFNAIDKAAEDFQSEMREQIEGERPVILRAEKRSKKKTVRNIILGVGGAAAAAALCVCVVSGVKGKLNTASASGSETDEDKISYITDKFDERGIVRICDVGFYRANWSEEMLESLKKEYGELVSAEVYAKIYAPERNYVPPFADVYYYNDIPLDARMLSDKAFSWLNEYCRITEEDREKMTAEDPMPDEVRYLTGKGLVRYGDLGFFEEKYTEAELERIKAYCATPLVFSSWPPEPDVYYYNDIAYNLDQAGSDDAKNWLKWYCWLDEKTQEELSGYVPEELTGTVTICNSEKPAEYVTYKGKIFDVRGVSHDTELYIKWYNSLPAELRDKVDFVPDELEPERIKDYPDAEDLPELIGADGVRLAYEDLADAVIYRFYEEETKSGFDQIGLGDIDEWEEIRCDGFVYLAENGSDTFKRYNVGDTLENGLKIKSGSAVFRRSAGSESSPELYYVGGSVAFEGTVKLDALIVNNDCIEQVTVAVSGLPAVNTDDDARAEGRIVPKAHSAEEFTAEQLTMSYETRYQGTLCGDKYAESDTERIKQLKKLSGQIVNVEVNGIMIEFMDADELRMPYDLVMYLSDDFVVE